MFRSLLGQPVREVPSGVGKKSRVERWSGGVVERSRVGEIAYVGKGWKSSREPVNGISWGGLSREQWRFV